MATLIFDRDEQLVQWAEQHYPEGAPFPRPLHAIGIADKAGKRLWAVAIYNNFSRQNVDFSLVALTPRWATRGTLRALMDYPFHQLGVKRMTAVTSKRNKPARRILEGVGFRLEGTHPFAAADGGTAVSYGLRHDTAEEKWFNG